MDLEEIKKMSVIERLKYALTFDTVVAHNFKSNCEWFNIEGDIENILAEIDRLTAANSALQKEVEGLKEEYDTADKAVRLANQEVAKLQNEKRKLTTALAAQEKVIEEIHDWQCGCGHWNGCNLPFCATCGRRPNET